MVSTLVSVVVDCTMGLFKGRYRFFIGWYEVGRTGNQVQIHLQNNPILQFDTTGTQSQAPHQNGQHSLTSVERPSYLRSGFVYVWRHARLVVPPVTRVLASLRSSTLICLMIWCLFRGLVLLFRSSLDWFNQEDATASVLPRLSLLAQQ